MTTETATAAPTTVAPKSQVKRKTTQSAQPTKIERVITPKLICQVTGVGRYTNAQYLQKKADARKCTVAEILTHYVSRDVAKLLREGKTVTEIKGILGSSFESPIQEMDGKTILRFNGKSKKGA